MKKKDQILIIHGGMTFNNKKDYLRWLKTRQVSIEKRTSWSGGYLEKKLGKKFEIISPRMPLQDNAQYEEWKICFERLFPYLRSNISFIGVSLGALFLAKYFSEHRFPKKIRAVYLVGAPFDDTIVGEDLAGGFTLKRNLSLLEKSTKNLHLLFSKDDDVVPVAHAGKYRQALKSADIKIFKGKNGHFRVSQFPEIVKMIKEG